MSRVEAVEIKTRKRSSGKKSDQVEVEVDMKLSRKKSKKLAVEESVVPELKKKKSNRGLKGVLSRGKRKSLKKGKDERKSDKIVKDACVRAMRDYVRPEFWTNFGEDYSARVLEFLEQCISFFRKEDRMKFQGLFRVGGNEQVVNEIFDYLVSTDRKNEMMNFDSFDHNSVATVFKRFFGEMKTPLFLESNYALLVEVAEYETMNELIKVVVGGLSKFNAKVAYVLFSFLKEVACEKFNLMNASNLAIVFGPSILRPEEKDYANILFHTKQITKVITAMIENCHYIFSSFEESQTIGSELTSALMEKHSIRVQNNSHLFEDMRTKKNVSDIVLKKKMESLSKNMIEELMAVFENELTEFSSDLLESSEKVLAKSDHLSSSTSSN